MSFSGLWAAQRDISAAEEESHSKCRRSVHCLRVRKSGPVALERSVVRTKQPKIYGQVGGLLGFICYSAKVNEGISASISERGCEN